MAIKSYHIHTKHILFIDLLFGILLKEKIFLHGPRQLEKL